MDNIQNSIRPSSSLVRCATAVRHSTKEGEENCRIFRALNMLTKEKIARRLD